MKVVQDGKVSPSSEPKVKASTHSVAVDMPRPPDSESSSLSGVAVASVISGYHEDFILEWLRYDNYYVPAINPAPDFPAGLEIFTSVQRLLITKREIIPDDDRSLIAYCQYDVMDQDSSQYIALGFEKADRLCILCVKDARLFTIRLFNYETEKVLRIQRLWSCGFLVSQYLLCCIVGRNGLGNKLEICDGENEHLGTVKQCPFLTRGLAPFQGKEVGSKPRDFKLTDFCSRQFLHSWRELRLIKLEVTGHKHKMWIRIEELKKNCGIFKLITSKGGHFVNSGYVRKYWQHGFILYNRSENFSEREMALVLGACFLLDHMSFEASIEGSYMKSREMEDRHRIPRTSCSKFFNNNRVRLVLILLPFFTLFLWLFIQFVLL